MRKSAKSKFFLYNLKHANSNMIIIKSEINTQHTDPSHRAVNTAQEAAAGELHKSYYFC